MVLQRLGSMKGEIWERHADCMVLLVVTVGVWYGAQVLIDGYSRRRCAKRRMSC